MGPKNGRNDRNMKKIIAIVKKEVYNYPTSPPFLSDYDYPELEKVFVSNIVNNVFSMVRESFVLMGYDKENYGTDRWNPLGQLIRPGDKVLIKPNMVMHQNHNTDGGNECLYTHPSVVAAVLIYVLKALKTSGSIIVGDAPMQECDFNMLINESGYLEMINFFKDNAPVGIKIEIIDFRDLYSEVKLGVHKQHINKNTNGVVVDLGSESEFHGLSMDEFERLRITNYDPDELKKHHNMDTNEYMINSHILDADVIINVPKPKTHRKAGVTIALKNLVGINARKEYLPHHMNGAKEDGGDEYLYRSRKKLLINRLYDIRNRCVGHGKYARAFISKVFIKLVRIFGHNDSLDNYYEGNWYGNDTISKTIVDLNKIVMFADHLGKMTTTRQRKYFIVADMIISGEKEGPVAPSPKNVGIIAAGENPVCFDEVIATLMGADINKIPSLRLSRKSNSIYQFVNIDDVPYIVSNIETLNGKEIRNICEEDILNYVPTSGWRKVFRTRY